MARAGLAAIPRGSGANVVPRTLEECAEPRGAGRSWGGGVGTGPGFAGGVGVRLSPGTRFRGKAEETRCVQRVRTLVWLVFMARDIPGTLEELD